MPYIQRDAGGTITGVYANAQPGYAKEFLDESNPAVIAYRNPVSGLENYRALIRRRAKALTDAGKPVDALILLHTIGE